METLIVNMFAGPGAGKSTTASGLFTELKLRGVRSELVQEYAKTLCWQKRQYEFSCQPKIFGKQLWMIESLVGQVDVIVTDSPILLSAIYEKGQRHPLFKDYVLAQFASMHNLNVYINRVKPYDPEGRNQKDVAEAIEIDTEVEQYLTANNISCLKVDGDRDAIITLADYICFNYPVVGSSR